MKSWVVGVATLCLMVPSLRAQDDAAKRAKVEQLFTVMRLDHTMDQLLAGIRQQTTRMMSTMPGFEQMTPEQKRLVDDYESKVMALVTENIGWKAMEPEMIKLYAATYSDQEIDGLLTFYKSPVGQTMLDKTPELTSKSLQITQTKAMALQPKVQALMSEFAKQFAAAAPAASKPEAGKPDASKAPEKPAGTPK